MSSVRQETLAVLAIEEVAHRVSPRFIRFFHGLAFVGVHAFLGLGSSGFGFAAFRTAVGKARFIGFQLEFFRAHRADSDWECHLATMIQLAHIFFPRPEPGLCC